MKDRRIPELAQLNLRASGITERVAKSLRLRFLTTEETVALTGFSFPSIAFLYFTLDGKLSGFQRLRLLPNDSGEEPPFKYWQRPGTAPQAYFPPFIDWTKIAEDVLLDLLITEGEKKAACGCLYGYNTVGLGGVWSYQSKKRGQVLLPDLVQLKLSARRVVIVYDSDASVNPDIPQAEDRLLKVLFKRGAKVGVVRLPPGPDGAKQGLDDFLQKEGKSALDPLIAASFTAYEAGKLTAIDRDFVVVRSIARILEVKTGIIHTYADFKNVIGANYSAQVVEGRGLRRVDNVKLWLDSEGRNEVAKIVYEPGLDYPYCELRESGRCYNSWPGFAQPPTKGELSLFLRVWDSLFRDTPAGDRKYLLQWLAWPVQRPGDKLATAVLVNGPQGIGKSVVGEAIGIGVYGKNFVEIGEESLKGQFNSYIKDKQFALANEFVSSDRRGEENFLKNLITRATVEINQKYIGQYHTRDCVNWYLTSNAPDAVYLARDDRRFFVVEIRHNQKLAPDLGAQLMRWARTPQGGAALHYYLRYEVDCTGFNPKEMARMTRGKERMIELGRTDIERWACGVMEDPRLAFESDLVESELLLSKCKIIVDTPYVTGKACWKALYSFGARPMPPISVKKDGKWKKVRTWALANVQYWETATHAQLAAHLKNPTRNCAPRKFAVIASKTQQAKVGGR